MKYRPEIDGLRALAVLPVILFHAGLSLFSGGFIGVDVFFVISGYLIASLILEELEQGQFSLRRFYMRRARRILPALMALILATIPFAYLWLLPWQYEDYAQSLLAVMGFVSNILFWRESGYFAADSLEKPLLHTWSLAVEEQFYLAIPILLVLLWRVRRHRLVAITMVAACFSLALCDYASRAMPAANFYLIPTRAWELLVGVLCAVWQRFNGRLENSAASLLGLAMIAYAVFAFDDQMRLPSVYTLVPVLGAALVLLFAHGSARGAQILSWRPLVGLGLISYSVYLWHHPLIAFARIRGAAGMEAQTIGMLIGLSLALGALSWRFIEQPFRNRSHPGYVSNRCAAWLLAVATIGVLGMGMHGYVTHGRIAEWKRDARPEQLKAYELLDHTSRQPRFYDNQDCIFNVTSVTEALYKRLVQCHKKHGKGVAIIGDSHAINLFFLLTASLSHHPFVVGISAGMCRPHDNTASCYYDALLTMLARQPDLFSDIIYKQAGFYLVTDARGNAIERKHISDVPLGTALPEFHMNMQRIHAVKHYLLKLAPYARILWLGPRVEPQIRPSVVVRHGCNATFSLRPNQLALYRMIEKGIADSIRETAIHFRSQMDLVEFDMAHDFINCDEVYFSDGDHFSAEGEKRFGKRMTLEMLLKERPTP
jgi:peptidoglycan/LPS O-acetylase OafA/YrhL